MKAILKFELPDDQEQFNVASKATDLWLSLWDISQYLRKEIRNDKPYEDVAEEIYYIMESHGVSLEMMS